MDALWLLAPILVLGYFLPALIADWRHHQNKGAIFLLNLLLGIFGGIVFFAIGSLSLLTSPALLLVTAPVAGLLALGWIIALVWSATAVTRPAAAIPGIRRSTPPIFGDQMICIHCGQGLPDDATNCTWCGKKPGFKPRPVQRAAARTAAAHGFCPACGQARAEGASFCAGCGARLD